LAANSAERGLSWLSMAGMEFLEKLR